MKKPGPHLSNTINRALYGKETGFKGMWGNDEYMALTAITYILYKFKLSREHLREAERHAHNRVDWNKTV